MDKNLIRALLHQFSQDEYRPSLGIARQEPFASEVDPRQIVEAMQALQLLGLVTKHPETNSKNASYRLTSAGAALYEHLQDDLATSA